MNTEKVDVKLAYLAGLFEGEGCAHIRLETSGTFAIGYGHHVCLTIKMTDKKPVEAFYNAFGGHIYYNYKSSNPNAKQYHVWVIHGIGASRVAQKLFPYILSNKKRIALQCIIDFGATMVYRIGGNRQVIMSNITEYRNELYQICKRCNSRGNNNPEVENSEVKSKSSDKIQLMLWEGK